MSGPEIRERLERSLGAAAFAGDGTPAPTDREGLRRAVEILHEARQPFQPTGGGAVAEGRLALSTAAWRGVLDLWPEDLVARMAAGTVLGEVQESLSRRGLRVPATGPARATLGGLFAAGERGWRSGPNRGLRESVLGLCAVDGAGRLLKGGGRVVKNVAGYDLVRLHHGAGGAFGVVVDLVVKLEPLPEAQTALWIPCPATGVAARVETLRAPGAALDPVGQVWLNGAAARRAGREGPGLLLVAEGWAEAVGAWRPAGHESIEAEVLDPFLDGAAAEATGRPAALLDAAAGLPGPAWAVVDLQAGRAWLGAEAAAAWSGGRLVPRRPAVAAPPSAVVRRLKEVFDPRGLLPFPPAVGEVL